ncbi:MAG: Rubredoxin [Candidatus Jettenia ecosi]|uniref:Rubredoxin n=1 Tax=Candidatus Jettenia ecosi TaxID=2494326 RepID=A0A533QHS4_9BACT|nr:MAG: Rubredoxin [Candidatus Jettenia ecosi]
MQKKGSFALSLFLKIDNLIECSVKYLLLNIEEKKYMSKWECRVCGYVYDPEKGDPDNGVKPGTSFEDLPDDWICPSCGAGRDMFDKLD